MTSADVERWLLNPAYPRLGLNKAFELRKKKLAT
jgi:hypothetical protein